VSLFLITGLEHAILDPIPDSPESLDFKLKVTLNVHKFTINFSCVSPMDSGATFSTPAFYASPFHALFIPSSQSWSSVEDTGRCCLLALCTASRDDCTYL